MNTAGDTATLTPSTTQCDVYASRDTSSGWWNLSVPLLGHTSLQVKMLDEADSAVRSSMSVYFKQRSGEIPHHYISNIPIVMHTRFVPPTADFVPPTPPVHTPVPRDAHRPRTATPPVSTSTHHTPLVEASELTVAYNNGHVVAVDKLTLTVPNGVVRGILGGNGAGKTSTLKTFGGVIPPTAGTLRIGGYSMSSRKESELARRDLGYCPDTGGLIRQSTVREHLGVALALRNMGQQWPEALDLVDKFGLLSVLDRETGGFSHGMSRRLSVLLAVLTSKSVLILDEPFDGVDPMGVEATEDSIRGAAEAGLAVIVSTHLLSLLSKVSDRICVMSYGKIVADDAAETFRGDDGIAYYDTLLRKTRPTK